MNNMPGVIKPIYPAATYEPSEDICIITCYFNPRNYRTKLRNYNAFSRPFLNAGIALFTIELAFDNNDFQLDASPTVLQIKGGDALWQKERLLNYLISQLPPKFEKVVWADADILFERADWLQQTSKALDTYSIVQPFASSIRLPKNEICFSRYGERHKSFCAEFHASPNSHKSGIFELHGHTGYAWAARRNVLEACQLYDACLSGSGDHLMAHAFVGDFESGCVKKMVGKNRYYAHFVQWGRNFFEHTKCNIGYVEGYLLHLWHGQTIDRHYHDRSKELIQMGFDPFEDIIVGENNAWKWNNQQLKDWSKHYFDGRLEDGIK